jgi:hypothetical protein
VRQRAAPASIRLARLVFTSNESGRIDARSEAVTIPRVASSRRMWSESTSHAAKDDCLLSATV